MGTPLALWLSNMFIEPLTNGGNDSVRDEPLAGNNFHHTNGRSAVKPEGFANAYAACNFIVTWNGEDVQELLTAIKCARDLGDRFIQDKLIEYILNIPFRNPRPGDVPAFAGKPVWAVDKKGYALVGMPGAETIVSAATLRESSVQPKELAGDA